MQSGKEKIVVPRNFKLLDELEASEKGGASLCSLGLAAPDDTYLIEWVATIFGPEQSTFADRIYSLTLTAPQEYPNVPPKVKFVTKVKMTGVDAKGNVDVAKILRWSPDLSMHQVLEAIRRHMSSNRTTAQPAEGTEY